MLCPELMLQPCMAPLMLGLACGGCQQATCGMHAGTALYCLLFKVVQILLPSHSSCCHLHDKCLSVRSVLP